MPEPNLSGAPRAYCEEMLTAHIPSTIFGKGPFLHSGHFHPIAKDGVEPP